MSTHTHALANASARSLAGLLAMVTCVCLVTGCATQRNTHELTNAVLWTQTSIEADMAAEQVYQLAQKGAEEALLDTGWTAALEQTGDFSGLPPAVIVDVDETILDNSPFQARLARAGQTYSLERWQQWVNEANAQPVPGAKAFVEFLKSKDVTVFYVTNRELKEPTLENLRAMIDPDLTADRLMVKYEQEGWTSNKTSRRELIAAKYRIILLVGDDYNDFTYLGSVAPAVRNERAVGHRDYWGSRWILLSNPQYGNWERSLYEYDYDLSDAEILQAKTDRMDTAER